MSSVAARPSGQSDSSDPFNLGVIFTIVGILVSFCVVGQVYCYRHSLAITLSDSRQWAAHHWGDITKELSRWRSAISQWFGMVFQEYLVPAVIWVLVFFLKHYDKIVEVVVLAGSIVSIKKSGWGGHTPHNFGFTLSGCTISIFAWCYGNNESHPDCRRVLGCVLFCLYTDGVGLVLSLWDYYHDRNAGTKLGLGLSVLGFACSSVSLLWEVVGRPVWLGVRLCVETSRR